MPLSKGSSVAVEVVGVAIGEGVVRGDPAIESSFSFPATMVNETGCDCDVRSQEESERRHHVELNEESRNAVVVLSTLYHYEASGCQL